MGGPCAAVGGWRSETLPVDEPGKERPLTVEATRLLWNHVHLDRQPASLSTRTCLESDADAPAHIAASAPHASAAMSASALYFSHE